MTSRELADTEAVRKHQEFLRRHGYIADKPIPVRWKVSEHRRDKRTGPTRCKRMSAYAMKQYRDAMRKWR